MYNNLKNIGAIFLGILILTACMHEIDQSESLLEGSAPNEESQPYIFVENVVLKGNNQKRIYRISEDGSHVEHIYDFEERILYWFSPDFHYLAFQDYIKNDNKSELVLNVIDVQTNQLVNQISDITPYLNQDSVLWSPGNDKILFDKTVSDRGAVDWWIYDIGNDTEEVLVANADTTIKLFPAWSPDGQYIAYVSTPCPNNRENCNESDDIWDITSVNLDTKIIENVTNFAENSILFDWEISDQIFCILKWSSDNRFIAFENQCILGGSIYEKHQIFIVDTVEKIVQEVLKFEHPYSYTYKFNWLETNELLIGYTSFDFYNFLRGGILNFDPFQQTLHVHSAELFGFRGNEVYWSPNGSTFIGFTKELFFEATQDGQLHASGATLLGKFSDGNLIIDPESNELPYGLCQGNVGYWSTNGQYIAYSSTGQQHVCNQTILESDVFVYSVENKELVNVTPSLEGVSRPIGWAISNAR